MTRSSIMLTTWGPDQVFDIKPQDEQYKTLEWYMLQFVKGAVKASVYYQAGVGYTMTDHNGNPLYPITGVAFQGRDTVKKTIITLSGPVTTYIGKMIQLPPLIFINGRELYMDEYIQAEAYRDIYFNMPITKFKKIVVKHMVGNVHGVPVAGGKLNPAAELVDIDRYLLYLTLDENAMVDNPGFLSKDIAGYNEPRKFYEPLPNAKPSPADYRTTIHWEPNIKTDATGKATVSFYNAVPQTNVRVIVEGITDKGEPIVSTIGYEVK